MPLADSARAIGAVTRLLQDHLTLRGFEVAVGRPEDAASSNTEAKLNLFLYETTFDAQLRNHPLRNGEAAPLWLVLRYLLTAFDQRESSDSAAAHELLGRALAVLQTLAYVPLDTLDVSVRNALEDNPEPLKLSFEDANVELLSKVMQGSEEHYRLSMAFQVRPVLIAPAVVPPSSLLVGVNYNTAPNTIIGQAGVGLRVIPSLGPRLERLQPSRFDVGDEVEVFGSDLNSVDVELVLGNLMLQVLQRRSDRVRVRIEADAAPPLAGGTRLSCGEMPLLARRRLSPTRTRSSNLLAAQLRPTLNTAVLAAGNLTLTGTLLGLADDDVVVALLRESDGLAVRSIDTATTSANQQSLVLAGATTGLAAGNYRVVLRVNNQQARFSPQVAIP